MGEFDYFGATDPHVDKPTLSEQIMRSALPAFIGAFAALIARKSHPVLTFLGVSALAGNVQAVARGERTVKDAARRLGRHVVATAGALAMPGDSAVTKGLGYFGGAIAGDLLFDGDGNGVLDEWAHHVGIEPDHETKAIVVREKKT